MSLEATVDLVQPIEAKISSSRPTSIREHLDIMEKERNLQTGDIVGISSKRIQWEVFEHTQWKTKYIQIDKSVCESENVILNIHLDCPNLMIIKKKIVPKWRWAWETKSGSTGVTEEHFSTIDKAIRHLKNKGYEVRHCWCLKETVIHEAD